MKLSDARLKNVLQLTNSFYDAATQSLDWKSSLNGLERLFPMEGVIFERHDVRNGGLVAFESSGLPDQGLREWQDYYHSICPRVRYLAEQPVGAIGYDLKVLQKEEMARHPLYQDFLRKYGVFYFLSVTLERDSEYFTSISMQRTFKQGHARAADIELLEFLTPHLQNALRINRCLESSLRQTEQLQASLHGLKSGVLIVDQLARLEFINRSAEVIVQSNAGIIIRRSVVSFESSSLQNLLQRALSGLSSALAGNEELTGFLPADTARPWPIRVDFLKLPARTKFSAMASTNQSPAARLLIVINVPGTPHPPTTSLLKDCFHLTDMEARLAVALADGDKLKHYAEQHNVSITTVRTHLANLRQKMGAGDQADVVRIVLQLSSAIR